MGYRGDGPGSPTLVAYYSLVSRAYSGMYHQKYFDKQGLNDGEIKEADADDRAYYIINDKGREFLRNKN
ncbi:hypothetical protein GCM10009067_33830 [Haloarcula sebkhae]|uniref:Uncharacterized protein n=1 Tax=Haloarcula sebkhae TaxID=932660 RepID=A0A830EV50_9EURY|nr:hypothetical protein GCM10009067_33830 [Haloarcula sebkhae]